MAAFTTAPIGTCRIHTPLRDAVGRYPIKLQLGRNYGFVHTSAEALHAGVPSLVVPHGFDQHDNAARLQRLGVAEVLPATRYRAARAARLLEALAAPSAHASAATIAATLGVQDGAHRAADLIEAARAD